MSVFMNITEVDAYHDGYRVKPPLNHHYPLKGQQA